MLLLKIYGRPFVWSGSLAFVFHNESISVCVWQVLEENGGNSSISFLSAGDGGVGLSENSLSLRLVQWASGSSSTIFVDRLLVLLNLFVVKGSLDFSNIVGQQEGHSLTSYQLPNSKSQLAT